MGEGGEREEEVRQKERGRDKKVREKGGIETERGRTRQKVKEARRERGEIERKREDETELKERGERGGGERERERTRQRVEGGLVS